LLGRASDPASVLTTSAKEDLKSMMAGLERDLSERLK